MVNQHKGQDRLGGVWASAAILASSLALGCGSDSTDPGIEVSRAPTDLTILAIQNPPTLVSDTVSFWAVRGEDRAVEMFYSDSLGQPSDRVLRFAVGRSSLDRYPDNRKFKGNDSVLITIRITDPATLAFDFEPSGLRFQSRNPAELTVAYGRTLPAPSAAFSSHGDRGGHGHGRNRHDDDDDDEDEDDDDESGDSSDPSDEVEFGIWMQEQVNGAYTLLNSRIDSILTEVEADVPGFSRYAVAY